MPDVLAARNEAIRTAHANGASVGWLAAFYGITPQRVGQILDPERERRRRRAMRERHRQLRAAARRATEAT